MAKGARDGDANGGSARTRDDGETTDARAANETNADISELALPRTMSIAFPNGKDDLLNFVIAIKPDEGYYRGGTFEFSFAGADDVSARTAEGAMRAQGVSPEH